MHRKLRYHTVPIFGYCDSSMRKKVWRCHKREVQATRARQGDFAGVTRARQRQSFERMRTYTAFESNYCRIITPSLIVQRGQCRVFCRHCCYSALKGLPVNWL